MSAPTFGPCPPRFAELKREIASTYPNFEAGVTRAWNEVLGELKLSTAQMAREGTNIIPQVQFEQLTKLSGDELGVIRQRGCVVIRDVVSDSEAVSWRDDLRAYIAANPQANGTPEDDKQFFQLFWTKSQVRARAHPNVLATIVWLNNMYHLNSKSTLVDVDLETPLAYADRFRIRHPGNQWNVHPPHVDGGSIERWEDEYFRSCFEDILKGDWRKHDPYELEGRIKARNSLYKRENQSSVFRTYQGWLALSETSPGEGTLQVFPDVILANAYNILRPFFRPRLSKHEPGYLDAENWIFDISSHDFPGIYSSGSGFIGPRPNEDTHPHLMLDKSMVSVPKVHPGDMVFWHCDMIHAVEVEHKGTEDSCVMYIPAVPYTAQNEEYIAKQKDTFLRSVPPPDFPQWEGETGYQGVATPEDIKDPSARRAMGLAIEVA